MKSLRIPQNLFSRNNIIIYIVVVLPFLYMAALSKYIDCISYTAWSVEIWDALFSGRIREYFRVTAENFREAPHGGNVYGILYLLPWGIWNFPLWLSRIVLGKAAVASTLCLLWSKFFLIACAHIVSLYCSKIVRLFTDDEESSALALIYILASGTIFLSVSFFGQDEIVYMAAFVSAVYYILCERKLLGYVLLGLSVLLCNFMIIPCAIIFLIKEKNLLKFILFSVCSFLPEKIVSVFCGIGEIDELAKSFRMAGKMPLSTLFDWFFLSSVMNNLPDGKRVSYFGVAVLLLFVVSYLIKFQSKETENYYLVLLSGLSLLAINIFAWTHCYRWFISFPLLTVLVLVRGYKDRNQNCGLLFMTVFDASLLSIMITLDYCLRFDALKIGFIRDYWISHGYTADFFYFFHSVLKPSWLNIYWVLASSLRYAMTILILIFLFRKNWNIKINCSQKVLSYVHASIPLLLTAAAVMIIPVLVPVKGNLYSTDTSFSDRSISYDMKSHHKIEKVFTIKQNYKIKSLSFRAYTWHNDYGNAKLKIAFRDADGNLVSTTEFPLSSVLDNDMTQVPISKTQLSAGMNSVEFMVDDDISSDFAMTANTGMPGKSVRYDGTDMPDVDLCLLITGK